MTGPRKCPRRSPSVKPMGVSPVSFSDDAGTMIHAKAIALVGENKVSYYEDGASLDTPFAVITMPAVLGGGQQNTPETGNHP